jgi:hypothetical protein
MKGIIAWIVGVALTASPALAPKVMANENGEVHYWSSSSAMAPSGVQVVRLSSSDRVVMVNGPATPLPQGTRVYFVNDDPGYDLSGPGEHWFLVGNGTAFQSSWRQSAALASTGTMRGEVVPITAEYRQDWLAVSAGDRPVRTFTAPRPVVDMDQMAMGTPTIVYVINDGSDNERYSSARYTSNGNYRANHPKRKYYHRRTTSARYSAVKHRHHRTHRAVTASARKRHRPTASYSYASNGYRPAQVRTAVVEPAATTTAEVEIRRDEAGNELFQMGGCWYMKSNGEWLRSESWRGPFARVKKGMVPREVKMSEDHPSRMDMD